MSRGRSAVIVAAMVLAAATGWGQTSKNASKPTGKAPAGKVAPKQKPPAPAKPPRAPEPSGPSDTSAKSGPESTTSAPPATGRGEAKTAAAGGALPDAGVKVIEKDGGAKQFRFTETEVEGRLKAPQLVYFLRRVRAEFAAGDLGHRSFMRELSETKRDPSF